MTHIVPCWRCPLRKGCAKREEVGARVKGLGLLKVEFECGRIADELRPGRRIVITRADRVKVRRGEYRYQKVEVSATIIKGHTALGELKFWSVVDPGLTEDQYRWRKPLPHHRIVRFLDEPDANICSCGFVIRGGIVDQGNRAATHGQCYELLGKEAAKVVSRMGVKICNDIPF